LQSRVFRCGHPAKWWAALASQRARLHLVGRPALEPARAAVPAKVPLRQVESEFPAAEWSQVVVLVRAPSSQTLLDSRPAEREQRIDPVARARFGPAHFDFPMLKQSCLRVLETSESRRTQ